MATASAAIIRRTINTKDAIRHERMLKSLGRNALRIPPRIACPTLDCARIYVSFPKPQWVISALYSILEKGPHLNPHLCEHRVFLASALVRLAVPSPPVLPILFE